MIEPARLLGFAFANADLLLEVERDGDISFATGALNEFTDKSVIVGRSAAGLFDKAGSLQFTEALKHLPPGKRSGPLKLRLERGAFANVALFRLPQNNERVSCTLSRVSANSLSKLETDSETGFMTRDAFLAALRDAAQPGEKLALVEVSGLSKVSKTLSPDALDKLFKHISKLAAATGSRMLARIGPDHLGALDSRGTLGDQVRQALRDGGLAALNVEDALISLKSNGLSSEQRLLALRHVLERFSAHGVRNAPGDVEQAFDSLMRDTETRALELTNTFADGGFSMAYQPIRALKDGKLSHFEALARFEGQRGPAEIVSFAESLGLSDAFDLATSLKVISAVESRTGKPFSVALNLSGRTFSSPNAFGLVAGHLARKRSLASRLLIEVTETAEITDLVQANSAIQSLRQMGYRVGLDDFGAGAASLQYLQAFTVDFVKFDGALVRGLGKSDRDDTLVSGMIRLCRDLGVETIAEYVEDEESFQRVREFGFDLGQGYYLGKPVEKMSAPAALPTAKPVRRRGVQPSWE